MEWQEEVKDAIREGKPNARLAKTRRYQVCKDLIDNGWSFKEKSRVTKRLHLVRETAGKTIHVYVSKLGTLKATDTGRRGDSTPTDLQRLLNMVRGMEAENA